MKKILVPTDFSKHAEYALEVAANLAKKHKASLLVLHMMGLSESILTKDESQEMYEAIYYMKLVKKQLKKFTKNEVLRINLKQMKKLYMYYYEQRRKRS